MKIAVASGKGGTGKTTISVNLALSLENVQLVDCDVEEPDCNVYLGLPLEHLQDVALPVPHISKEKCTFCGKCADFCQFNALAIFPQNSVVFAELCHGCGGCTLICPEDAITEEKRTIGTLERGSLDTLEFLRGVLNIGEPMATPVIRVLKQAINSSGEVILDSPPGNGCPVIETVSGCDFCLLVTEPTPFGLHDLKMAVTLTRVLDVPCGVLINRWGMGSAPVEKYCSEEHIPVLMKIPHERRIAELCARGIPFVEKMPSWKEEFRALHQRIGDVI
ncbi:MAG: ATP-binding protein [Theionarchaea archaeon]|nr:ATP-binding protein [Theionarchaea archaeon]MBU7000368.1 ATP-binding protein [Theionarchaea archaeon]MBU7021210.1 ATP-binding protein [Theionarchaea archaeon]